MAEAPSPQTLGPNEWLVDEMYEQYLANPTSVSQAWQEFFADYKRDIQAPPSVAPAQPEPTPADSAGFEPTEPPKH